MSRSRLDWLVASLDRWVLRRVPDGDPADMAAALLRDRPVVAALVVRALVKPLLPGQPLLRRLLGRRRPDSVIFLHSAYYHFKLLAEELRRRGWDALFVAPVFASDGEDPFSHGEDHRIAFDRDRSSLLDGLQLLVEIGRRFSAAHFYGVNNLVVNPTLNRLAATAEAPGPATECDWLKARGVRIAYSMVGCNDGIAQSSWNTWTGGMCDKCRFRNDPRVCSDIRNLGWGQRIASTADLICGELMPRLDFAKNPRCRTLPMSYPVDAEQWAPDLDVPERFRLAREPDEVVVLHAVGNYLHRSAKDADPKGTRAVAAAVDRLRAEGHKVRLEFLHSVPSVDMKYYQAQADIIVDQLLFGRYGATARECMMLGKPVVGYLKVEPTEEDAQTLACLRGCPMVNATEGTIYQVLRDLVTSPAKRRAIGQASRAFAVEWHSVGRCVDRLTHHYARIGVGPSRPGRKQMYHIPLIRPVITQSVKDKVIAVLDSGYLSEGPTTRAFEAAVQGYLGGGDVHAVTSATTGLEIALRALGVGPGDEVVVPDFTYPATADVVAIVGATTVLADVDPLTMTLDMASLERALTPATKVVMPVSAFGNPVDYRRLNELKARHGFKIVEDAAPALGAWYDGRPVGRLADITVFSLHPRKSITTGEGGLVVTDDRELANWINSYKHFGMEVRNGTLQPQFARIGTNCKLSDVLAAIGLAQMEMFDDILGRRREQARIYADMLAGVLGVTLSPVTPGGVHAYQSFPILVEERDRLLTHLRGMGIEVQIGTYALHREPAFQPGERLRRSGSLNGSLRAFDTCLVLPMFHHMTLEDQKSVVRELTNAL